MQNSDIFGVVLGLDIGDSRIGVARAHTVAKLPEPLSVIDVKKQNYLQLIEALIKQTEAVALVVGLPIPASGTDSDQTIKVRNFAKLLSDFNVPIIFVDESYSSLDADMYLQQVKTNQTSNDAIAACVILERYFASKGEATNV